MGSRDDLKSPPSIFIGSGLDSKQSTSSGVNFYGENDDMATKRGGNGSSSIQYHMLDPSSANNVTLNKSSIHKYQSESPEAVDSQIEDQTNTTNTSESDEATMTSMSSGRRGRFQRHVDGTPSQRDSGVGVSEALEKQFIQARLIKTSAADSPKQSTPNIDPSRRVKNFVPFTTSYDRLMNTTANTDTDDDQDANSKRLLTNKVETSRIDQRRPAPSSFKPAPFEPPPINRNELQSGSMLSNATNMTNVTPLANVSLTNTPVVPGIQYSSSDYENLSNSALNEILDNYPKSRVPIVADRKKPPTTRPPAPPTRPPPIYNHPPSLNDDDDESLISCQLITSASLLMNRDLVKEARHVTHQPKSGPLPPSQRTFVPVDNSQARKSAQDAVVQVQADLDGTKPPPMETAI